MAKDRSTPSIFTARPSPEDVSIRWTIHRAPHKRAATGIITCDDLVGCYTHYWKGRTLPCNQQSCEACDASHPRRWHGYLSIFGRVNRQHAILEITANAVAAVDDYAARFGALRGAELIAERRPPRPNGRLILTLQRTSEGTNDLPQPPNLEAVLMQMWELSWSHVGVDLAAAPGNRFKNHHDGNGHKLTT